MKERNGCILCFFSLTPLAVTPLPCRPHHTSDYSPSFLTPNCSWGKPLHLLLQGSITMPGTKIMCTQIKCNNKHHHQAP
ncbi:hypothetical protein AAZX31_16G151400 [Glycine max]|uniref:Secreted protein n=2 Tax=Glycine subgen. Soja TaxID=1462606 RepID=K7MHR8_SOYBN|nr:hypothetical protein JHK86_045688 [Glycine max]KAG4941593.1 hypothetical protein JHK87_045464 [Glycine soja]KAG4952399.1 hypothetical protein JHK85_046266 [Glycine max]KAG5100224.1 hypothetical protein JHK82_045276 [Glycine max]KAG5108812.1 hypothetical protein JHK84_045719 [Glycine max]